MAMREKRSGRPISASPPSTEAEQARRIGSTRSGSTYVGPVYLHRPGDGDTENFGLERSDGTPKPVVATSAYARNGIPDAVVDRRIRAAAAEPGWRPHPR